MIITYEEFVKKLNEQVFKEAKVDLIEKLAENPNRFTGIFRPTTPKLKLLQNITQKHEIKFGDFIEDIITLYLEKEGYINLTKNVKYEGKKLLFDQLFYDKNTIYMIEQKMRDDHGSTKKDGQFNNFVKKIKYLKETYPEKNLVAGMWFVDPTFKKNENFYKQKMEENKDIKADLCIFYGEEFANYLNKPIIWNELTNYLTQWKKTEKQEIKLNFESDSDWLETKSLLMKISKSKWKKIINEPILVDKILPILFPTSKYKEVINELDINN